MSSTVPLCEGLGLKVPAHRDEGRNEYVLEYPFPCAYDAAAKRWDFAAGEISWDEVFARWKARGPMNVAYVESIQRSRGEVGRWLNGRAAA
jgi:ring-1,2-phenylacetyl-CoA epoxidase subunit PaaA